MSLEKIIILDFDGVICNSIDECLLTSYNTYFSKNHKSLNYVPNENRNFFYKHRHFVRPAREFALIHKAFDQSISNLNLDKFNTMLKTEISLLENFERDFFAERNMLKQDKEHWLSLHKLYPEMKIFLEETDQKFFILTTKDSESVTMLSDYFNFTSRILGIYSKEISNNKKEIFDVFFLDNKFDLESSEIIFVDDNEWHLNDVESFPIKLYFAKWGYSSIQSHNSYDEIDSLRVFQE